MYRSTITKKVLNFSILASVLLVLAGCSDSNTPAESPANLVSFTIAADGGQEIPANDSTGTATGSFNLDLTTLALSGSVTVNGTEAIAAHIHEGVAGSNGGVILALDIDGTTISVPEGTTLASDQMASMLKGDYYLNIHSDAFGAGELRDQFKPPGLEVIRVSLSGENQVPAVASQGSGTGYVTLDTVTGYMHVQVITTGITTPTVAHVHSGLVGANGDPLFVLTQDAAEVGNYSGSVDSLAAADLASVLSDGTYINVHSAENPAGELRGQITR